MVPKFQDDPTVNEFGILVLLGHVWVYVEKRKNFRRERKENEFGRKRESIETYHKYENWHNISLFIVRVL